MECNISKKTFPFAVHEKYLDEIRTNLPSWNGDPEDLVMLCPVCNAQDGTDRTSLILAQDGQIDAGQYELHIASLRELFRGNANPGEFTAYPDEYIPFFHHIEKMLVERARNCDDSPYSDDQFIEVYSALRRRPDGRSIGFLHDLIWQRLAFFLLVRECSQGEYESCIQKLERGARKYHMNYSSHNYYDWVVANIRS